MQPGSGTKILITLKPREVEKYIRMPAKYGDPLIPVNVMTITSTVAACLLPAMPFAEHIYYGISLLKSL